MRMHVVEDAASDEANGAYGFRERLHVHAILGGVVTLFLTITFACGLLIAVAHVVNKRFIAPAYDVVATLVAFASAVGASSLLGHWMPATLSAVAFIFWLLLAQRTRIARKP